MMTKELEVLEQLNDKQIVTDLFNIVSNGKYDMNDLTKYFARIDKALNELEQLRNKDAINKSTEYIPTTAKETRNELERALKAGYWDKRLLDKIEADYTQLEKLKQNIKIQIEKYKITSSLAHNLKQDETVRTLNDFITNLKTILKVIE